MKFTEPKTLFLLPSFACVPKTPTAAIPASPHKPWCPQNQSSGKSGGQSPEHSRLQSQERDKIWHTPHNAALTQPALTLPPARPLTVEGLFLTPGCNRIFWRLCLVYRSHCVCQKPSLCCWLDLPLTSLSQQWLWIFFPYMLHSMYFKSLCLH